MGVVIQLSARRVGDKRKYYQGRSRRTKTQRAWMAANKLARSPDEQTNRRRDQQFRLRVKNYTPSDDVNELVKEYLNKGGRVTKLKPGLAFGLGKLDHLYIHGS